MKKICLFVLTLALLASSFPLFAAAESDEMQAALAEAAEMLKELREEGVIVVFMEQGVTAEQAEELFINLEILSSLDDREICRDRNDDYFTTDKLRFTLVVSEERIMELLARLNLSEIVEHACPNYFIPIIDGEESIIVEDRFDSPEDYCETLYGDVDRDWKVGANDYLLVKRYVLGTFELSSEKQTIADVDQNGTVNAVDYLLIKRSVLGTYGSLGVVIPELTPNRYADLTDEELFALIDEELAADPEPEGRNVLAFTFKRIKRESQASAVLDSLGFSGNLYDETIYRLHHGADMILSVYMVVPPEQLRDAMFALRRCDEIGNCLIHGDDVIYAD